MLGRKRHDARSLLLLGLLREQSRHGYRLHEFIQRNLQALPVMKKPTAYALLNRLCQEGYVSARSEPGERRAERRIYATTPEGERLFGELLRQTLSTYAPMSVNFDIGLLFVESLPRKEVLACLAHRLAQAEANVALHESVPPHSRGPGVDLALAYYRALLRTDRDWLAATIERLQVALADHPHLHGHAEGAKHAPREDRPKRRPAASGRAKSPAGQ